MPARRAAQEGTAAHGGHGHARPALRGRGSSSVNPTERGQKGSLKGRDRAGRDPQAAGSSPRRQQLSMSRISLQKPFQPVASKSRVLPLSSVKVSPPISGPPRLPRRRFGSPPNQPLLRELRPLRAEARHTQPGAGSPFPPKHSRWHGTATPTRTQGHEPGCSSRGGRRCKKPDLGPVLPSPDTAGTWASTLLSILLPAFPPSLCLFLKTTQNPHFYIIFLLSPELLNAITFQQSHHVSEAPARL